jgi:hypothetical protein
MITETVDLSTLVNKLKSGEYDGVDIMHAGIAVDELIRRRLLDYKPPPIETYTTPDRLPRGPSCT